MDRLEAFALSLPEATRVDIQEWGDHPTFRVRGKNFVFCDGYAANLSVKLTKDEAAAAVATESWVSPSGYGLGRHGWVSITLREPVADERWRQVEEWVLTSYSLIAPKSLARLVTPSPGPSPGLSPGR